VVEQRGEGLVHEALTPGFERELVADFRVLQAAICQEGP
jgi:hypothetical protein